ncbi:hypothetical protein BIU82_03765 [Arthrobacter sp. SW1]|nr:hypothetical protein BIU82_03765 [Arthrobacter sp. SW1]
MPADIKSSGKLRVGLSANFPPMEFKDKDEKYVGADVDLQKKLGEVLGVQIEIVEAPFDQLINSVQTGRVDMVMSGMTDTVERQKSGDFVDYFRSQGRLYTTGARAGEFTKQDDACGKKVAVSGKTEFFNTIKTLNTTLCTDKGKPAIEILAADSGPAARLQLDQGRADLAAQGAENLAYFAKTEPGKYATVLDPLPSKPNGILVKKGNTQLLNAIKDGMQKLYDNGEYKKVLDQWGIAYGAMKPEINGVK